MNRILRAAPRGVAAVVLALVLAHGAALAQTRAFVGATLHPIDAPVIEDGVLLIDGTKIRAVGQRGSVRIPRGRR